MTKNPQTASSLAERDQAVVWHPFTQMKTAGAAIPIVRGEGTKLYDEQGNAYIDAIASWWMNTHGHSHPYIAKKLYEQAQQLEHVIFANFTHEPAVQLAERLLSHLPSKQARVFYSDNGSTSVEVGLKMCFQYWHNKGESRKTIVAFEGAYHGDTFGAMSVGKRDAFTDPFAPYLFDVAYIPAPLPGKEAASQVALQKLLATDKVAGFIFEPLVQGAGGMRMYAPKALEILIQLCQQSGALCIADEVMTGFGRTGKWFASEHLISQPDIMCLSKGLTGGCIALGATTCTEEIFDAFWSDDKMKTLFHGHSCTGNPLSCSVGLASMDLMEREETWDNIRRIEQRHAAFAEKLRSHDAVANLRQCGVVLAFDFKTGEGVTYFSNMRDQIWDFFISRKLIMRPLGNTIYILPPYCITDEELDTVYGAIWELLEQPVDFWRKESR